MRALLKNLNIHKELLFMALPGVVLIFMFSYMPMFGLVTAFKKFNFTNGIFGSPWVGLDNFRFLFNSSDITWRLLKNTVGYYIIFTIIGTVANVSLAIALNECRSKWFAKISQSLMILPTFISWIAVTFIVVTLLDGKNGMFNHILLSLGKEPVSWYTESKYWTVILTIINIWKFTGYGSILYLSALAGMDQEMFEAADLDGATKWQQTWYITLPMLVTMITVMTLISLGGIMTSNTGLFFQVTKNVGALYPTTQTIDAYVINALTANGGGTNFGMTSAVTFLQSTVGCVMVVVGNLLVRKWDTEHSLF